MFSFLFAGFLPCSCFCSPVLGDGWGEGDGVGVGDGDGDDAGDGDGEGVASAFTGVGLAVTFGLVAGAVPGERSARNATPTTVSMTAIAATRKSGHRW